MKEKIINILKDVLETNDVDENTNQQNCPLWDSLHHLNIAVEIEDEFNISLEPEDIASMHSVDDIVAVVSKKLS